MANPQIEKGYIRIATEIWEALVRTRIPAEPRQVMDCIIRKTYGFQKKSDQIATSQIMEATGLNRRTIERARTTLRTWGLITTDKKGGSQILVYRFNKDYETWQLPTKLSKTTDKNVGELPTKKGGNNKYINNTIDKSQPQAAAPLNHIENVIVKKAMDQVCDDGFNIYAMIARTKRDMKQPSTWRFPDEVILKVCEAYHKEKPQIKDPWPWFLSVLKRESSLWFSAKSVVQGQEYKKPGAMSLKEILAGQP